MLVIPSLLLPPVPWMFPYLPLFLPFPFHTECYNVTLGVGIITSTIVCWPSFCIWIWFGSENIVNCAYTTTPYTHPLELFSHPPVVAILISFFSPAPTLLRSLATFIISKQINVAHMWHHFMRRVYLLYGIIVASPPWEVSPGVRRVQIQVQVQPGS